MKLRPPAELGRRGLPEPSLTVSPRGRSRQPAVFSGRTVPIERLPHLTETDRSRSAGLQRIPQGMAAGSMLLSVAALAPRRSALCRVDAALGHRYHQSAMINSMAPAGRRRLIGDRGPFGLRHRRPPPGINVVGHFADTSGLAEATRSTARSVVVSGYPMSLVEVGPESSVDTANGWQTDDEPGRFSVSVIHDNVFHAYEDPTHYGVGRSDRLRTIGYWYWELGQLPAELSPAFDLVDEVWVPTSFVQRALRPHTEKPVVIVPPAVDVEMSHQTSRNRFQLPDHQFLFLTMASVYSIVERKNPLGVVDAFAQAFDRSDDVGLVIKITDRDRRADVHAELEGLARDLPIYLIDERLSHDETLGLIQCCDCYVSLHRGEGFGLPIAEAMALGKPAIATAYSGNMDFTAAERSYLVNFDLVELTDPVAVFPAGSLWAEPRVDEAVAQMRSVVSGGEGRERITRAGQEFVTRHFAPAAGGRVIRERMHQFGLER